MPSIIDYSSEAAKQMADVPSAQEIHIHLESSLITVYAKTVPANDLEQLNGIAAFYGYRLFEVSVAGDRISITYAIKETFK